MNFNLKPANADRTTILWNKFAESRPKATGWYMVADWAGKISTAYWINEFGGYWFYDNPTSAHNYMWWGVASEIYD